MQIEGTGVRGRGVNLDPMELRFALLFWDQLVWPSSDFLGAGSNPDEAFLESAGILKRREFSINGDVAQRMA